MVKHIKNITHAGIDYIDEDGNPRFVDFQVCYDEWFAALSEARKATAIKHKFKCVGNRNILAVPPYVEFFTQPITRFEFTSEDGYYDLREKMERM